jgi:hypothetical protein
MSDKKLLEREDVIRWCFEGITEKTLANTSGAKKLESYKKEEQKWGQKILNGPKSQWTTKLCENLVEEALILLGRKNVKKANGMKSSVRDKKYSPDLECDNYVYEVKGRSWTTAGTAGEKVLGVPLKYGEIPSLYKKPLQIVLVGYQEYEAREKFAFGDLLDPEEQTEELRNSLAFYKENDIEYIGFTDILKHLDIGKEY